MCLYIEKNPNIIYKEQTFQMFKHDVDYSYEIRDVSVIHPIIIVVEMSEKYSDNMLNELIIKCKLDIFSESYHCKIVKIFPSKKNENVYQAAI